MSYDINVVSWSIIIQSGTSYFVTTCFINVSPMSSALDWYIGTVIK